MLSRRDAQVARIVAPTHQAFERATLSHGARGEWELMETAETVADLVRRVRLADLAILPAPRNQTDRTLVEEAVLDSGTPVLLVPEGGWRSIDFGHVIVAWDGSREAKRALADSLPLLGHAGVITVLTVDDEASSDGVLRLLTRHGFHPESASVQSLSGGPGAAVLRYCESVEAGLLVMGAYGQSRTLERMLGGATRTVFAEAGLPVMMSH
jgi:nucleotide-binding universal stress UspA family protein